jgi:ABC-2 type transport system permease protein
MLGIGARIATERAAGWNRQLRISPLTAFAYLGAKIVVAYTMAVLSLSVLYIAGAILGVRLPADAWIGMTALVLVGLIPFAALGILLGHLLTTDTIGPAIGGGTSLLALLSGTWFPLSSGGVVHEIAQGLPSYWLVQANRVALGGHGWSATGWLVVAGWSVALIAAAARAYRRDTARA